MKKANVSELKNNLSSYLSYVRRGGTVRVFDRTRPVADLVPLDPESRDSPMNDLLDHLEKNGFVHRRARKPDKALLRAQLPEADVSVVDALVDERRAGR